MASSVRFDTSTKHSNSQFTHIPASSNKSKEVAGQKHQATVQAHAVYQQKAPSQTSSQFQTNQYRLSPVKHTPSTGSNSNQTLQSSVNHNYASKETARSQIKSDQQNALAAQLFTSSEDDDDEYQVTSDNYIMGEEDGGDPLTCGDSDFEPAEQSIRGVVPFHLQHKGGKAQSEYYGLDTNNILMSQYDFDHDSSLLHTVSNDHYSNAIDYKLAGEHEIMGNYNGINLGVEGVSTRPGDNQESIYRLRSSNSAHPESQNANNYGALLNQKNYEPKASLSSKAQGNQNKNATKPESPTSDSSYSSSPHKDSNVIRNSKYTHHSQQDTTTMPNQKTIEPAKGNSSQKQSPISATYDDEDIDEDMDNDMEASSSLRLNSAKTQLTHNVVENVGSTNVRRFARNTGTYQSSFSKPTMSRQDQERSPDSEAEYHYYNKQQQLNQYKNDNSYSSEENDILIDPEFKSQYYYNHHQNESSAISTRDIEMKPIQNSKAKQQETSQTRINQKQAALNLANIKDNKQRNEWGDQTEESEADRFKSTAVGFSPNTQQVYSFNNEQKKVEKDQTYGAANISSGSKSLTSFGWSQNTEVNKKQTAPVATFETAQQVREREQYRSEQTLNTIESAHSYNQFATMYPQKQISKEAWETQIRNVQASGATSITPTTTQKEKRKKKKEGTPEAHFLLTGTLAHHLEQRSFFRNTDDQSSSKKQTPTNNQEQPSSTKEALIEWFDSLSLQDRVNSLTTTYPIFVQSIIEANQKHVRQNGPLCLFTIKKEKPVEATSADASGVRRRQQTDQDLTILERVITQDDQYRSHNLYYGDSTSCRQFQTKIIKFARITSNKQSMDTLTVANELVRETQEFFSLLENITDGKAFSQPISYVSRYGSAGKPLIQSPRWIDSKKTNYLGVWIVAILEETLWAHFNYAKQVNISSGVRKAELNSLFEPRSDNLLNQEDLAKRWTELADEGQQKLLAQLSQTAKEEQPAKFQAYADEMERRNPTSQSYQHAQHNQYNEDVFQFCNQAQRFGLYSFTEVSVKQYQESIYRSDLESQNPQFRSGGYHQNVEQQGHQSQTQGQNQQKSFVMFLQNDNDLKEIVDVVSYVGSLDLIKYLSEVPLQEVNQRNYMRKHFLCHKLHLMIQADLRQSIQDQLMNELLAIDSSAKTTQLSESGEAKKKKNKTDRSKKPRNQQQQNQKQQTYQKKKSISKSPDRKTTQPPAVKETVSRVASTTTSDDQHQLIVNVEQSKKQPPNNNKQQSQAQQRKDKQKHYQQQVIVIQQKQKEIVQHVQKLLGDIVESVCQMEQERQTQELQLQSELLQEKANQQVIEPDSDSEPSEPTEPTKPDVKEEASVGQQQPIEKPLDLQQPAASAKRRRRPNKTKKQDAEELVNQFVRKINGGDLEDQEQQKGKARNQGNNKGGQQQQQQQTQRNSNLDQKGQKQTQKAQQQQPGGGQQQKGQQQQQAKSSNQSLVQKPKQVQQLKKQSEPFSVEEPQPIAVPSVAPQKEKILPEPEQNKVFKKLPVQMSESQTTMVFNIENQPAIINKNTTSTPKPQPDEEVISLVPSPDEILELAEVLSETQEEAVPVKVSLSEHFNQQAFIMDFKTMDDIFDKQYDNSQIQFIDYSQQPQAINQQPTFSFNPEGKPGAMSTTSVSFTPTLQLSPQMSSISDAPPLKDVSKDNNLSPPLSKFSSNSVQPSNNNFFNEAPPYSKPTQFPQSQFDNASTPSKQQNYSGTRGGDYQKPGSVYKKTTAPFRQPQYQAQPLFLSQPQFGNKSPTSQSDQQYAPSYAQDQQSFNQRGVKINYKKSTAEEYPQQQFYQPFGSGSPTQTIVQDNSSSSSSSQQTGAIATGKPPQIRLDAPSFEPVYQRSQSDAPSQEYRNKQQPNWNQFGQQPQQQLIGGKAEQYAARQYDNQLPTNQHPMFSTLEDQFYRNFDRDIEKQTAKIQAYIENYEEQRQYVLSKLQKMANIAFPGRNPVIKVFGSLMTGLALESSDMDIAVTGMRIDGRDDMIDDLHALADQVQKWSLVKDFKAIETASIPVIKAHIYHKDIAREMGQDMSNQDEEATLPIDITFDDSPPDLPLAPTLNQQSQSHPVYGSQTFDPYNHGTSMLHPKAVSSDPMTQLKNLINGELGFNLNDGLMGYGMEFGGPPPPKTHLGLASCSLLKDYVHTYPYLKEVAVLLKTFLAENNLNQSYLGGISSYSVVLLIVAYMNNFNLHLSPNLTPSRLLMGFLDFYSNCFDPRHYGVNTTKGMSFYPLPQVNQHMFVIVDPVNPTNNTARNSFRTPDVLNHFRAAFFSLKSRITKQFQKQLVLIEAERSAKSEAESVGSLKPDWGHKASVNQSLAGQQAKVEKTSDGNGQRQRQGPNKKINAQSQQDPTVAKASEQQQPSSNFAGQTATTAGVLLPKGAAGTDVGLVQPTAQAFDSVNFVDCFLSSEIMSEGTDSQANEVEALSGFGGQAF